MNPRNGSFSGNILRDKVSVVTGAGRGLGKIMALSLAQAGSDLVLVARNQEEINQSAREVEALGQKTLPVRADVTRSEDIQEVADRALGEFGRLDILVNNAGQSARHVRHNFEAIPQDKWDSMIRTNITGVYIVSQILGRIMLGQRFGSIINIASSWGVRPVPEYICYSVTKAAVIQMTKALALEWAPRGIRVNCIAPGSFDKFPDSPDPEYLKGKEERKAKIPLNRLGLPEELGPLVVYLASDASAYVTGTTIFIDGGMVAG